MRSPPDESGMAFISKLRVPEFRRCRREEVDGKGSVSPTLLDSDRRVVGVLIKSTVSECKACTREGWVNPLRLRLRPAEVLQVGIKNQRKSTTSGLSSTLWRIIDDCFMPSS